MTTPRRRIIRPDGPPAIDPARQRRLHGLHCRLLRERAAEARWWKRLRRAINALEKHVKAAQRLERQLARIGETTHGPDH